MQTNDVNEIKRRLKAVKDTRQITNAMYLLSAARMKKAMQSIDFNLLYLRRLRETIKDILCSTETSKLSNPFMEDNGKGTAAFIILTADKGLCGDYNSAVVDLAMREMAKYESPFVYSLGLMGDLLLRRKGIIPSESWYGASQRPTLTLADTVAEKVIDLYMTVDCHVVYIVYTEFINSSVQSPRCVRMLPLFRSDFVDISDGLIDEDPIIYEPSVEVVFDSFVDQYITGFIYDVLMQASACENIARMNAMRGANDKADEMTELLERNVNALRQQQITNDITEIAAAIEAGGV